MSSTFNQLHRILVPVDLSERSELAMAYAAMLAQMSGAEIIAMINVNLPEREVLEEVSIGENVSLDEAAELALRRIVSRVAPGASTTLVASFADFPADGILGVADERDVDMIVIASHGRGGMRRWLLGSVAEKVARGSERPVVIVPARGD